MTARNRRAFLRTAGLGAYVVAGTFGATLEKAGGAVLSGSGENPDAELIALCARFDELERACQATYVWAEQARGPEPADWPGDGLEAAVARRAHPYLEHCTAVDEEAENQREPLWAEQQELFGRIMATPVATPAGARAIAATWRLWDEQLERDGQEDGYWPDRLAWKLVRSLTEMPT